MQHTETLEGTGEVSVKGGEKIGPREYSIDVWQPERSTTHLRGGGFMPILKRYAVRIELSPDDVTRLANRNAVLVLADGRPLPIIVKSDGTIGAIGGLSDSK